VCVLYRFTIKRTVPSPAWKEYTIGADPDERVLDALLSIKWRVDGTLTFRRSCCHGICGSDAMVINGRTRLACQFLIREAAREADPIVVEPLRGFPVVKDLVIDQRLFMARYRQLRPFLVSSSGSAAQSIEERERFDDTTRCILCGSCTASCPTFWADKGYVGPAAVVQAHRFIFDSRDAATRERLDQMREPGGVFSCRSVYNCAEVCPREIDIVKAIYEVRQAVLRRGR
jgi:succinate dehydrogenase / fumarate reductase iron-sulfur subunit